MKEKPLEKIYASDFYKIIEPSFVKETYDYIVSENMALKPSTKYSVLIETEAFPPKDI